MSIRIGILGYGNLGRGVECAIRQNPDMELVLHLFWILKEKLWLQSKFQFYNSILIFTKQLVYMIDCFSYVQRKEFI